MLWVILFFAELLTLFFLSRSLTKNLSFLLFRITKSKKITIHVIAFIFFPGTVIHELAHALTAILLGVQVGTIEFVPVVTENLVKLGSVQVEKTDFFRRFLIGAAPFFVGTTILIGVLYYASQNNLFNNLWIDLGIGYLVFEIGNTMFSSKKDMEGALELLVTLIVICIIFYILGVRLPTINPNIFFDQPIIINTFQKGCQYILIPLILDTIIIALLKVHKHNL